MYVCMYVLHFGICVFCAVVSVRAKGDTRYSALARRFLFVNMCAGEYVQSRPPAATSASAPFVAAATGGDEENCRHCLVHHYCFTFTRFFLLCDYSCGDQKKYDPFFLDALSRVSPCGMKLKYERK